MRPVVVTAVLLLVVLMSMSVSAAWNPEEMCRTKYPANYCRKDLGPGWFQFGYDRCVKPFLKPTRPHGIAMKHCRTFRNGDLVSIHNLKELELLECAMYRTTTRKHHYWIGLFWNGKSYVWTDSSKHNYSHWARGQPDSWFFKVEHCIEMNYWSWGLWNDADCRLHRPYVCQAKI